jgi:hypothetical protein
MKKIVFTLVAFVGFCLATQAQQSLEGTQPKRQPTKEEREMKRIKDEANLLIAFKQIGLDEEAQKKANEAMKEASAKSMEVRKNTSLSEEAKKTAIEEINKARMEKLKEIMGAEKFTQFQEIRKKQREEALKAEKQAQAEMPTKE